MPSGQMRSGCRDYWSSDVKLKKILESQGNSRHREGFNSVPIVRKGKLNDLDNCRLDIDPRENNRKVTNQQKKGIE